MRFFAFLRSYSNSDVATGGGGGRGPCPPYRMLVPVADLENFGGGDTKNFKHKTSKIRMSSPKLRVTEIQTFFPPKIRWSPKKKFFTEIETGFLENRTFFPPKIRWSPKKKKKRSSPKLRLIFRPKWLGLGWWGECTPKWRLIFRNVG